MSTHSGTPKADYFRKCGIHLVERKPEPISAYLVVAWLLFYVVVAGSGLYGLLLAAEWVLRAMGVNV